MKKKIPFKETQVLTYKTLEGSEYKITQHQTSGIFTIYKVVEDGLERLGTGTNPTKLEERYIK